MPQISNEQIEQNLTAAKEVDAILATLNQSRHRGIEAAITMLQGLLDQPEQEPVAYRCADCKTPLMPGYDCGHCGSFAAEEIEGVTHPAPFTPITADMVTDEMAAIFVKLHYTANSDKQDIANAVNAFMGAKE